MVPFSKQVPRGRDGGLLNKRLDFPPNRSVLTLGFGKEVDVVGEMRRSTGKRFAGRREEGRSVKVCFGDVTSLFLAPPHRDRRPYTLSHSSRSYSFLTPSSVSSTLPHFLSFGNKALSSLFFSFHKFFFLLLDIWTRVSFITCDRVHRSNSNFVRLFRLRIPS